MLIKIRKYGYIISTILMVLVTLFTLTFRYTYLNELFKYIIILVYYLLNIIGLYSFLKTDKAKGGFAIISMFCGLLLSYKIIVLLPVALIVVVSFKRKYSSTTRTILSLILVLMLIKSVIGYTFIGFSVTSEIDRGVNPDKTMDYVIYLVDQGALGADISVNVEKNYLGMIAVRKRLVLINNTVEVKWLDNKTLMIGDKKYEF